ncbi:hypothetical protein CFR75_06200 [Komagataeibacter xylinus]|uniref:Uncharacterized protein n=1 Tax=Komagataeibacter xylinus TaxID=28448 RepID=A0A318PMT0_KOMXY|nr:hypothetical protein CFR75_06200 [Komagataeibacter xylinus]
MRLVMASSNPTSVPASAVASGVAAVFASEVILESSMIGCGDSMVVRAGRPDNRLTRKGGYFQSAGNGRYSSVNT